MGYLNNTSVTIDAILTNKGRELLSKGDGAFNITQFALADDEVDYTLWNPDHPLGSDYYGVIIDNMPVTEAIPEQTQAMRYRLLTLDNNNTIRIPIVQLDKAVMTLNANQPGNILSSTKGMENANSTYGYTAILSDSSIASIQPAAGQSLPAQYALATVPQINTGDATSIAVTSKGGFTITAKDIGGTVAKSATITIIANETGGSATATITVNPATIASNLTS